MQGTGTEIVDRVTARPRETLSPAPPPSAILDTPPGFSPGGPVSPDHVSPVHRCPGEEYLEDVRAIFTILGADLV
jgi:hypothetical protein